MASRAALRPGSGVPPLDGAPMAPAVLGDSTRGAANAAADKRRLRAQVARADELGRRREPWSLRLVDAATQGLNVAGSVLILALTALIGADVAGRSLFDAPVRGVPELVTLSIVAIVFFQIPQALRNGRLTRTQSLDFLLGERAPAAARLIRSLFDGLGIAAMAIIVRMTWPMLDEAWRTGEYVGAVGIFTAPVWPVKAAIVIGGTFTVLQFAADIYRRHRGGDAWRSGATS